MKSIARHFKPLLLTVFMVLAVQSGQADTSVKFHWTQLARQVGQNETESANAIAKLKKIKNLQPTLLKALDTPLKPLALDVISALRMENLIPHLLERVNSDEDGFLVLTINSLLSNGTRDEILNAYIDNLDPLRISGFSPAALMAMLEPLGRAENTLPKDYIEELLAHDFPEVQSATLHYLRLRILRAGENAYSSFIMKSLQSPYSQIRLQSVYLIGEIKSKVANDRTIDLNKVMQACRAEKIEALKQKCLSVTHDQGMTPGAKP